MHNTEARWEGVQEGKEEENDDDSPGRERRRDAIRLGGFETKKRAVTTSARAARTEAEINRRKSLLPSALSGPFRPVKIIYRKDWCARASFSRRMNFETVRSVMRKF